MLLKQIKEFFHGKKEKKTAAYDYEPNSTFVAFIPTQFFGYAAGTCPEFGLASSLRKPLNQSIPDCLNLFGGFFVTGAENCLAFINSEYR